MSEASIDSVNRKRQADEQLTKDINELDKNATTTDGFSSFSRINPFQTASTLSTTSFGFPIGTSEGGFGSFSKNNPFANIPKVESFGSFGISSFPQNDKSNQNLLEQTSTLNESSSFINTSSTSQSKSFFSSFSNSSKGNQSKDDKSDDGEDSDEENGNDNEKSLEEEAEGPVLNQVYKLPENAVVVTGEEDQECIKQVRGKLFRWGVPGTQSSVGVSTSPDKNDSDSSKEKISTWLEVGVGPVRILQEKIDSIIPNADGSTEESKTLKKVRIVMRREEKKGGHGTKLLLNVLLKSYVTIAKQGDKVLRFTCIHPEIEGKEPSLQTYIFKTKSSSELDAVYECINSALDKGKLANY